jgi:hypothetical protein
MFEESPSTSNSCLKLDVDSEVLCVSYSERGPQLGLRRLGRPVCRAPLRLVEEVAREGQCSRLRACRRRFVRSKYVVGVMREGEWLREGASMGEGAR